MKAFRSAASLRALVPLFLLVSLVRAQTAPAPTTPAKETATATEKKEAAASEAVTLSAFEVRSDSDSGYVASFIGMLPADHPRLVIAVSIHNPRGAHFGGVIAAPVFAKIATFAVQEQRIPPGSASAPRIPLTW